MDKYRCIQDFYISEYDEDGFPLDTKTIVSKDSVWELSNMELVVAIKPCVRLEMGTKWIEITPEHLEQYFEKVEVD